MPGWMTTLGPPFYVVYNPSGDNSTVCTDFTVAPGQTKKFAIDNKPPPGGLAPHDRLLEELGLVRPRATRSLCSTRRSGGRGSDRYSDRQRSPQRAGDCLKAVRFLDKSTIDSRKKLASDPAFKWPRNFLRRNSTLLRRRILPCRGHCDQQRQALLAVIDFNGNRTTR